MMILGLVCVLAGARAWSAPELEGALQHFLDDAAPQYQASLAVIVGGVEVAVATSAAARGQASRFLFGSGTKPFIATRVLQLVEAGDLALDDLAGPLIDAALANETTPGPTFASLFGPAAKAVTIGMLLGMRSGVADFDVPAFDDRVLGDPDRAHPPLEFVEYAATVGEPYAKHFACEPGTCINYSSTNYQLLGLVLLANARRTAPGLSWRGLDVKAGLFPPSDEKRFDALAFLTEGRMIDQGLDTVGVSGKSTEISTQDASILGWTCGNVLATATATARFFHDLLVAKTLLNATTLGAMTTFSPIDNGWGRGSIEYGLGLMIQQTNPRGPYPPRVEDDGAYVGHGGDTYGYLSEQGFYPTLEATIAVVANEDARGSFVKSTLACGAARIVANVTQGRATTLACG